MHLVAIAISDSILSSENCYFATQCDVYGSILHAAWPEFIRNPIFIDFFSLTRTSSHHPQQASRTDPKFARRKTETISLSLSLCVVAVASKDNNLTDLTFIDCVGRKKKFSRSVQHVIRCDLSALSFFRNVGSFCAQTKLF